jgi:spore germination protein GerM
MSIKYSILIILFVGVLVLSLKAFSNEDDWICENGQWIKHGNPSAQMPLSGCGEEKNTPMLVYFSNTQKDPNMDVCEAVYPSERFVAKSDNLYESVMTEMLKGPTDSEKSVGFMTQINEGVKINRIIVNNGVAKIDFDASIERAVGGSCRTSAIRAQIEKTLLQFPEIKNVVISVDGNTEAILQP